MKLAKVPLESYVREVLPDTHSLWGASRDLAGYADHVRATARGARVRSRPFTVGIRDGARLVASCKLYDRGVRTAAGSLTATGIGAVFTPPALRGQGYASAMLGMVLDEERADGRDFAFLYSDIHPAFYERLGFITLPSREFTVRADTLDPGRVAHAPVRESDWIGIRRCFALSDRPRPWGFKRSPSTWSRLERRWTAPPPPSEQRVALVSRVNRAVAAYVIGSRELRADAFWVDEFGFADEAGRARVPALVRAAAGDLRKVRGWLPPSGMREVLPGLRVKPRKSAIFMLVPLSRAARDWWLGERERTLTSRADPIWIADHV